MENIEILKKMGLNEKEASVYLALLELGTATVHLIASKAGIKRPTTYLILDQLQQKGIVSVVPRTKKVLFTAESPEKLLGDLHKKQELLKGSMPNLLALFNARKEKPQVQMFEGVEGVKLIYQKILDSNGVLLFGTSREIAKLDNPWLNAFMSKVKEKNLPVKDILSQEMEDIDYAKNINRGSTYEIKFLSKEVVVPADSAIFDDTIVMFSFRPLVFAVTVTSKDICQIMRLMYGMAWRSAEPYEKIIKS